nr:DUF1129 family protein [Lysinibacillus timonensis]
MKLTVKQIIQLNNEKRKKLTPKNEEYYNDLLIYIRMSPLKNERASEEKLMEVLDQLLEGQNDGKTAEELFGTDPKQLADNIIQSLPKESYKEILEFGLEIILSLFGWYLIVWGIWPMIQKNDQIGFLGSIIISGLLLVGSLLLIVYLLTRVIRKHAFKEKKNSKVVTIIVCLALVLLLSSLIVQMVLPPLGPRLIISYYTPFGLGCFFLLASYILKKSREAK